VGRAIKESGGSEGVTKNLGDKRTFLQLADWCFSHMGK
jgi:hypothetical protein